MSDQPIYIRMRHKIEVVLNQKVKIGDIAQVIAEPALRDQVIHLPVHTVRRIDNNFVLVDVMKVIKEVREEFGFSDVQSIGPAHTILEVKTKVRKIRTVYFVLIWLLRSEERL